jgi:hypothetical protein
MHRILQVEMCGQSCQVIGIMVHVVAVARLARPAWPRLSCAVTR